ncbi:MAG TPA: sugar transferase [Ignavibacteriaceae bacterium]|nr:sugar transferase [Ignavibacteriaceae bacterium]
MIRKILLNLLLYIVVFIGFYIYRRGFEVTPLYLSYFAYYLGAWALAALVSRKFKQREKLEFLPNLYPYLLSFILMMGVLAGFTAIYRFYEISNYIILASMFIAFFIETSFLLYSNGFKLGLGIDRKLIISYKVFLFDLLILIWVFLFTAIVHYQQHFVIDDKFLLFLIGILIFWMVAGSFSHQFPQFNTKLDYWRYIWGYLKSYTIFMALTSFTMIQLRYPIEEYSHIFFGGVIYTLWSFIAINIGYLSSRPRQTDEVSISLLRAQTIIDEVQPLSVFENHPKEKYSIPNRNGDTLLLRNKLSEVYLNKFPELFDFIDQSICLNSFDLTRSVILRSRDIYNVEVLPDNYLHLFMNLHEINDLRRINAYFIEVNKRLVDGGLFIGRIQPIMFRYRRFQRNYPFYLGQIFYFFDFLWKRAIPKLPFLKKIYFALTQGKDRALSLAEGLGRLYYCGFEIVGTTEENDFVYFIARKAKEPFTDTNPSYGPLFKMKRIGKEGKPIFVYKMRTMHPYSEYLMKYVYEKNGTIDGDKILNDFRISTWGYIFRKLWIDELPMLINWLKGELKIVGVRPISEYKFSLYPEHLKKLRSKYKPGLIPPYYVDLPKNQKDFFLTEEKYLESYSKAPISTDLNYFFKALYNIFVKKARSG